MREKSPRRADAFTAEAVTLNFSKCLNTFAHLLSWRAVIVIWAEVDSDD